MAHFPNISPITRINPMIRNWTVSFINDVAYTAAVGGFAARAFKIASPIDGAIFTVTMRIYNDVINDFLENFNFYTSKTYLKKTAKVAILAISTNAAVLTMSKMGVPITSSKGGKLNLAAAATLYALDILTK